METFSALLALCEGNSPVSGEFPSQKPVTRSFDVFFDLRLKRLSNLRHHRAHYDVTLMWEIGVVLISWQQNHPLAEASNNYEFSVSTKASSKHFTLRGKQYQLEAI